MHTRQQQIKKEMMFRGEKLSLQITNKLKMLLLLSVALVPLCIVLLIIGAIPATLELYGVGNNFLVSGIIHFLMLSIRFVTVLLMKKTNNSTPLLVQMWIEIVHWLIML
ncbi:hypothetical protein PFISCL1PPCAC_17408, partial [Pristionchus fissidentatus]